MKRLNHPNLIPIFLGIALGCILGSTPFYCSVPNQQKLGQEAPYRIHPDKPFRTTL